MFRADSDHSVSAGKTIVCVLVGNTIREATVTPGPKSLAWWDKHFRANPSTHVLKGHTFTGKPFFIPLTASLEIDACYELVRK